MNLSLVLILLVTNVLGLTKYFTKIQKNEKIPEYIAYKDIVQSHERPLLLYNPDAFDVILRYAVLKGRLMILQDIISAESHIQSFKTHAQLLFSDYSVPDFNLASFGDLCVIHNVNIVGILQNRIYNSNDVINTAEQFMSVLMKATFAYEMASWVPDIDIFIRREVEFLEKEEDKNEFIDIALKTSLWYSLHSSINTFFRLLLISKSFGLSFYREQVKQILEEALIALVERKDFKAFFQFLTQAQTKNHLREFEISWIRLELENAANALLPYCFKHQRDQILYVGNAAGLDLDEGLLNSFFRESTVIRTFEDLLSLISDYHYDLGRRFDYFLEGLIYSLDVFYHNYKNDVLNLDKLEEILIRSNARLNDLFLGSVSADKIDLVKLIVKAVEKSGNEEYKTQIKESLDEAIVWARSNSMAKYLKSL